MTHCLSAVPIFCLQHCFPALRCLLSVYVARLTVAVKKSGDIKFPFRFFRGAIVPEEDIIFDVIWTPYLWGMSSVSLNMPDKTNSRVR